MSNHLSASLVASNVPALGSGLLDGLMGRKQATSALDSREVGRLFSRHGALVYGRARRLLGNHEDAEEATQEIFMRLMSGVELPADRHELVCWLTRVTTNYCLNRIRDSRRRRQLFDEQFGAETRSPYARETQDRMAQARSLLAKADERQAQAAVYVFVDGMSHEEAAEMLGVSKRTVGNLIERLTTWAQEQAQERAA